MTRYEWLDNDDNRDEVYDILRYTLEDIQPDELPFLEGVYGNYVDLAREGDVVLDDRQRPFNFAGADDVISVWLIPLTIEVVNYLIITVAVLSVKAAIEKLHERAKERQPSDPDPVRECIRQALDNPAFKISKEDRDRLEKALVRAVRMMMVM